MPHIISTAPTYVVLMLITKFAHGCTIGVRAVHAMLLTTFDKKFKCIGIIESKFLATLGMCSISLTITQTYFPQNLTCTQNELWCAHSPIPFKFSSSICMKSHSHSLSTCVVCLEGFIDVQKTRGAFVSIITEFSAETRHSIFFQITITYHIAGIFEGSNFHG